MVGPRSLDPRGGARGRAQDLHALPVRLVPEPVAIHSDEVVPDPGADWWTLEDWVDDRTAVGIAVDGPGSAARIEPEDSQTLVSCVVPRGECTVHQESTDQDVTFPQEAGRAVGGLALNGEPS